MPPIYWGFRALSVAGTVSHFWGKGDKKHALSIRKAHAFAKRIGVWRGISIKSAAHAYLFSLHGEQLPRPCAGHFFFHFSRKAEFVITSTDPALCTSAPTTGFSVPLMASTIAKKFSAMEKLMLHLMVVIIRLDRATR